MSHCYTCHAEVGDDQTICAECLANPHRRRLLTLLFNTTYSLRWINFWLFVIFITLVVSCCRIVMVEEAVRRLRP